MKHIISIVLVCILFLGCINVAAAEEFQLRNGIHFGDDLETVKSKETLPIRNSSKDDTNDVWFDGKIAGIEGSVRYTFDEENKGLIDMQYSFDSNSNKDFIDSGYSTLYNSLVRKYGKPLGNTGGNFDMITGSAFDSCVQTIALYMYLSGTGDLRDYDEWIVECDGYNVKIDLISYYRRSKDYDYYYQNVMSYHYFTDQDRLDAINKKMEENAAVDNDL